MRFGAQPIPIRAALRMSRIMVLVSGSISSKRGVWGSPKRFLRICESLSDRRVPVRGRFREQARAIELSSTSSVSELVSLERLPAPAEPGGGRQ